MQSDTARHILLSLLAEKNITPPEDADMRELIVTTLDCDQLPDDLVRPLTKIFTAAARDFTAKNGTGKAETTDI